MFCVSRQHAMITKIVDCVSADSIHSKSMNSLLELKKKIKKRFVSKALENDQPQPIRKIANAILGQSNVQMVVTPLRL